jgi:hypothetical protein
VVEKSLVSETQALAHLKHRAPWRVNQDAAVRSPVDMPEDQHKVSDATGLLDNDRKLVKHGS